ncbi:phosphodiesterase [Rhizobium halophilum]|uniref:phosphodiesterase n=1 Tax=Rhizobium halophilum TaxID=2846852 RepID=UPI001EFC854D|nr:phosphodiesterase [Rhizobium halophilum]MCF6368936.1 phosphodiesterase [Rhizobium halophilum]
MKIIQITDTHLMPPGMVVNGVDPEKQLRAAVADIIEKHSDADLGVMTGDLCNFGDPEAYTLLKDILAPVPFEMRLLLGNHDDRRNFRAAFSDHPVDDQGFIQSALDTPYGRLLFLDSHEPRTIGGMYGKDRLGWLENALEGAGEQPVTVFIHHPPMDCGIAHFEHIGMHDGGRLMQRLTAHPAGVRHIVFGHIHVLLAGTTAEGIAFSSGQACAHRFITDLDAPAPLWTGGHPCYRIVTLSKRGFHAFSVDVGEVPTAQAVICAGP